MLNRSTQTPTIYEKEEEGCESTNESARANRQTGSKACQGIDCKSAGQKLVIKVARKHRGRRMDFSPFAASVFVPHIFTGAERASVGCGAGALSLLTGVPPEKIAAKHRGRHYSDNFMIRFLMCRGFRTLKLTPFRVSSAKNRVGPQHVILISQLLRDCEATWGVIFEDGYFHNFNTYSLSSLALLNKPILTAYLVIHPSWRITSTPGVPQKSRAHAGPKYRVSDPRKWAEFSVLRDWC